MVNRAGFSKDYSWSVLKRAQRDPHVGCACATGSAEALQHTRCSECLTLCAGLKALSCRVCFARR